MSNSGKDFEIAVYNFVKTLDPDSEVIFDHKIPDKDTGTLRQCDVWINAMFKGHWPLSILVSCKDWDKKIDIGEIGKFINEIKSTGASFGVIYSRVGFTKPALKKAKANGISCCRLYQNEPADIPELLIFQPFVCSPSIRIDLLSGIPGGEISTWNDLYHLEVVYKDIKFTIIDLITKFFHEGETKSMANRDEKCGTFPDWYSDFQVTVEGQSLELLIRVAGRWKYFRSNMEAILVDGSYVIDKQIFSGTQSGPFINIKSAHPGDAWEEIGEDELILPSQRMVAVLHRGDVKETLVSFLGPQVIG